MKHNQGRFIPRTKVLFHMLKEIYAVYHNQYSKPWNAYDHLNSLRENIKCNLTSFHEKNSPKENFLNLTKCSYNKKKKKKKKQPTVNAWRSVKFKRFPSGSKQYVHSHLFIQPCTGGSGKRIGQEGKIKHTDGKKS
jgi:hypothetical protein